MATLELMRLQYEILNISLESLAKTAQVPISLLEREAKQSGWRQLWPESDEVEMQFEEGEDKFSISSDAYIEKAKKRLTAFSLARETALSMKYLELEAAIIDKAQEVLDNIPVGQASASVAKVLASLYRDMSKNLISAGAANNSTLDIDGGGIPTLLIRDLSGQKSGGHSNA